MSEDGGPEAPVLQRHSIQHTKVPQHQWRRDVSSLFDYFFLTGSSFGELHILFIFWKLHIFGCIKFWRTLCFYFFPFYSSLPQIYEEFYHTVNNADHEKDLRWWSNTHGVNMAMNWPQFEVCSESLLTNTFEYNSFFEMPTTWDHTLKQSSCHMSFFKIVI